MKSRYLAILAFALLASVTGARATFIDTSQFHEFLPAVRIGEPNLPTFGQTFTVTGPDSNLEQFSFRFNDNVNPDFVDFAAYIYAWDGTKATGSQLFASSGMSSTNNSGQGGLEQFVFRTGGLPLVMGNQYVAFISSSNFFDGARGTSTWEYSYYDLYSGGEAAWHNNGNDFSRLTTESWKSNDPGSIGGNGGGYDLWFIAQFSTVPVEVPIGSSLTLIGLGLAGIAWFRGQSTYSENSVR